MSDRTLEGGVACIALNNRKAALAAAEIITPEMFEHEDIGKAFGIITQHHAEGKPIDIAVLYKAYGEAGGDATVIHGIDDLYSRIGFRTDLAEPHAKIIYDRYVRRTIIERMGEVMMWASDDSKDTAEIRSYAESAVFALRRHGSLNSIIGMDQAVASVLERMEAAQRLAKEGKTIGVPSGFKKLDQVTLGWQPTDLIIIAARPSVGKSAFAGELVLNAGCPSLVFSLEMSAMQLAERMVLPEANIDKYKAMTGRLSDTDWVNVTAAAGRIASMPIYVEERGGLNIEEVRSLARQAKLKMKDLGLIVVDYLQLATASVTKNSNREQEIARISSGLKNMAKELEVPVVALSQLNRIHYTERPDLSNLRECLPVDEWVDTPRGPVMIGSKPNEVICHTWYDSKVSGAAYIQKKYNKVKTIRTGVGAIRTTSRHLIMTGLGWKEAGKIEVGDVVAVPKRINIPDGPPVERPYLLGMLIGNGGLSGTPALCFRKECQGRIESELRDMDVSITYRQAQKSDNVFDTYISRDNGTAQENELMRWIRSLGLEGKTCHDKFIPEAYMMAPETDRVALLQGLWDSDGTVTGGVAKYATVSEVIARQVKWLLHTLGILSSVNYYDRIWEVRVLSRSNAEMEAICSTKGRHGKLGDPCARFIDPCPQLLMAMIDHLGEPAIRIQRRPDGTYKEFAKATVVESMDRRHLVDLMNTPYYKMGEVAWIKVSAIEDGEKEVRVCDLGVPVYHNFCASGIVVHNSGAIEQDADVVCFLWREPDLPNGMKSPILNFAVDKNRHGPLGSMQVTYKPGSARLVPYASEYE